MLGRGKSGSELLFIQALSPTAISAGGSSDVFDIANAQWLDLLVMADGAGMTVKVEKSAASDTGFVATNLSLTTVASQLSVRSMKLGLSSKFVRVAYDDNGNGTTAGIVLIGDELRTTPVPSQDGNTNVHSNII